MSKINSKITNFEKFDEIIRELKVSYGKMKDIFDKEKINAEKVNATDIWTGEAQRAMYDKYSTINGNYGPIEYALEIYIKFLNKSKEDYRLINEEAINNMTESGESLDVNS